MTSFAEYYGLCWEIIKKSPPPKTKLLGVKLYQTRVCQASARMEPSSMILRRQSAESGQLWIPAHTERPASLAKCCSSLFREHDEKQMIHTMKPIIQDVKGRRWKKRIATGVQGWWSVGGRPVAFDIQEQFHVSEQVSSLFWRNKLFEELSGACQPVETTRPCCDLPTNASSLANQKKRGMRV